MPRKKINKSKNRNNRPAKSYDSNENSPASSKYNEYLENRRLDASRDYWQIRDHGRFGSHSSYDDMGDESFS